MEGALDVVTPGLGITAVAATARLLCDEEADVVISVGADTKATTARKRQSLGRNMRKKEAERGRECLPAPNITTRTPRNHQIT